MAKLIDITGKAVSGEWGVDDLDGTGRPVLRTTNFTNNGMVDFSDVVTRQIKKKNLADKLLRHGDIILEKSGGSDKQPVGRVVFFEGEENKYLFNNFTGLLRVKNTSKWIPKYVFYSLFANYNAGGTKRYENRTTGLHNLQTDSYVASVDIEERSIEEQNKIVARLDKVTLLMDLRQKQIQKLDQMVKSRFIELFGNVGDAKYPIAAIGTVAKLQGGYAFKSSDYCVAGVPLVQISNVNRDNLDWNEVNRVPFEFLEQYSDFILRPGDLVMAMTRPVIKSLNAVKIAFVTEYDFPCLLNQRVGRFCVDRTKVNSIYLMVCCQMQEFRDYVVAISGNSLQPNISSKQVENYKIVMPPIELQNQFAAFVEQVNKSRFEVQQSLEKLETLKKSLMQQYFG